MTRSLRALLNEFAAGAVVALLVCAIAGCAFLTACLFVLPLMALVRWS